MMFRAACLAAAFAASACATPSARQHGPGADQAVAAAFETDRAAILAMTGDYDVTFYFEELVALAPGYALHPVEESHGRETVFVVEDAGDLIRLQHILVVGPESDPQVVKHWRQDWVYEPERVLAFVGKVEDRESWTTRATTPEERAGAWSQTVYQVDDSPRYAAVARWSHANGVSTWESPLTWRPLPRRDATTRDDYDVMAAVNRHTITHWGWAHEQDNEKLVLAGDETTALVREVGVNSYRAVDGFPHEVVDAYWANTSALWARVRDHWDELEASAVAFGIEGSEPDDPIYGPILEIVEDLVAGAMSADEAYADVAAVLTRRVSTDVAPRAVASLDAKPVAIAAR